MDPAGLRAWAVALRDTVKHSEIQFQAVGASKTTWLVLLLIFGPFAAVPYLLTVRRRLRRLVSPPD